MADTSRALGRNHNPRQERSLENEERKDKTGKEAERRKNLKRGKRKADEKQGATNVSLENREEDVN